MQVQLYIFSHIFVIDNGTTMQVSKQVSERSKLVGLCKSALHLHLSLNRRGHWGTIDDFTTSFLHFSLFSTAQLDLANSRPVHSLML